MEEHRKRIAFIAFLIIVENVALIAEPSLFGNLIDVFLKMATPEVLSYKSAHILDCQIHYQFLKQNIAPQI